MLINSCNVTFSDKSLSVHKLSSRAKTPSAAKWCY